MSGHGSAGSLGVTTPTQTADEKRWLNEDKATLQNLADTYGISAERVRQIEKNAMNKLKTALAE